MDDKALIILAEMLNKARIQANAIEATAPQSGVYGDIAKALQDTLAILTDAYTASFIYEALLDASSVKEAIALVTGSEAK
jgi:hypothetical protein